MIIDVYRKKSIQFGRERVREREGWRGEDRLMRSNSAVKRARIIFSNSSIGANGEEANVTINDVPPSIISPKLKRRGRINFERTEVPSAKKKDTRRKI